MANDMYALAKEKFGKGEIDWTTDTIRAYLVDLNDYTPDLANDEYLDDVPSQALVAYETLTNCVCPKGVFDADDVTFTSVTGDQSEAILLVKWTGDAATSPLLFLIDTAQGLPVQPSGADIVVIWDNGPYRIFQL